jgi:O-antigen/teichoic acid export membrane protein
VIRKLGIAGYGTWESIVAVSVLSNIFQTAISGTLLWMIANAYGAKDRETVHNYVRMAVFVSLLLFCTITPTAWFFRYSLVHLFRVPGPYVASAVWILPCVVGLMLLGCIGEIMGALIGGFQRAGKTTLVQAGALVANNASVVGCLLLGLGFWSLLVGFTIGFLVSFGGLFLVARRIVGPFSLVPMLPSRAVMMKVMPYAGFMLLGALSMGLRDQTDKIVLSSVASPVWTGYFGIAARLASLITFVCTFFYVPTIAAAGALFARKDHAAIHRLYRDVFMMMSIIVGLVVVLLAGLHDRIILLWLGKAVPEAGRILYILLAGNALAVILTGTGSSVCKGMGIVGIETNYIIVGLVLNIALKFLLVPLMGPMGTVVSSTLSWSGSGLVFVYLLHKRTDIPLSDTLPALRTCLAILVSVAVARSLSILFPASGGKAAIAESSLLMGTLLTLIFLGLLVMLKVIPLDTLRSCRRLAREKYLQWRSRLPQPSQG